MKLRHKLGGLFFLIVLMYIGVIGFYFLPSYKNILLKQKEVQLESTATQLFTMCKTMVSYGYSRDEIIKIIREIRYGVDGREYVLLLDQKGFCVQHPTTPALDNHDVSQVKDPLGFPLVQEYLKIANSFTGKGALQYHWPWFNDARRVEPKMAFVYDYKELDLIIIATAYINDVKDDINHLIILASWLTLCLTALVSFIAFVLIKNILQSINRLKLKLLEVDFSKEALVDFSIPETSDELGEVAALFNIFTLKLRNIARTTIQANETLAEETTKLFKLIQEYDLLNGRNGSSMLSMGVHFNQLSCKIDEINEDLGESKTSVKHATSAGEQLSCIIKEIANQTFKTQLLASDVEVKMKSIGYALQQLLSNNCKIDTIVATISDVSGRTSRLSVDAKQQLNNLMVNREGIECLVGEIIDLADQSAQSVIHINNVVGKSKEQTVETIASIKMVFEGIANIITHIIGIAAAIEEQSVMTVGITKNLLEVDTNITVNANQGLELREKVLTIKKEVRRVEACYDQIRALSNQMTTNVIGLASVQVEITHTLEQFKSMK